MFIALCFNPRTHVGCDGSGKFYTCWLRVFQSTHPCRVRQNWWSDIYKQKAFQSTHPCRVRLIGIFLSFKPSGFNPRTHVGCDSFVSYNELHPTMFQSTHPCRVRPTVLLSWQAIPSFNPRTHVGCDLAFLLWVLFLYLFQSTHPCRVRPFAFVYQPFTDIVSIHAPM